MTLQLRSSPVGTRSARPESVARLTQRHKHTRLLLDA